MHVFKRTKEGSEADKQNLFVKEAKLSEMLSLAMINSSSGPIKKMIHVPTFNIYAVKIVHIYSRETRNELKKLIADWENTINGKINPYLVSIIDIHWNTPEGCLSIVMEHMNGGSLLVSKFHFDS